MRRAGLAPRIDPAGNIFARREGTERSLAPVLFGSHIDSVPSGGNFDGDLGSLAAIGVIEALQSRKDRTRRLHSKLWSGPLEEGITFRSRSGGQPHRGRRCHAGGHGGGVEWHASRRCHEEDRRRPRIASWKRAAKKARGTATLNCTSNRAAPWSGPVSASVWWRGSSRSNDMRRRSSASPTTQAPRRWPSGRTL